MQAVLDDIRAERARQDATWGGERNHDDAVWALIAGEEFGEACKEALEPSDLLRAELVQLAAVTVCWIECIDRRRGAQAPL